jgi:hypothetical protein
MNFGEGLKRIVNITFYLWIFLGIIGLVLNIKYFLFWSVVGIILPIIFKSIIFYIINGFFINK